MTKKKNLPDIVTNFSEWYQEVISLAELAEQNDVKGCITVLPYGCLLWEKITAILNQDIKKKLGASNMMFPLFIPYSSFEKEKEHVDGFAPEVAMVTHAGGKKLEDPLVVRPTSEIIIHDYFKKKIKSWRDLPLKVNQWCSVVRWEKRPRAFLRTTEFWWQEGHTAHETYEQAYEQAEAAIALYENFCIDYLAIPVIMGRKPDYERFAGADITWTIEGMMQDGKAVQMGTSHLLGEGFAKMQGMEFQNKDMTLSTPHLTSWGVTTRLIGVLIMVHGDNKGLVLPPKIAPVLLSIIPIFKNDSERFLLLGALVPLEKFLEGNGIDYLLDKREEVTPGVKFFETEVKGIPFRIELGMRDLAEGNFTLYQRDINQKKVCPLTLFDDFSLLEKFFENLKSEMQERMLKKAKQFKDAKIHHGVKLRDFGVLLMERNEFYTAFWCGSDSHHFKEYQSSVRCVLDKKHYNDEICCLHDDCGRYKMLVLIARNY
jgi:prolyl-tRNA synthetase